ncbi:MAG: DUF4157 domain-containing protein, partial [Coleofasciculus sp. C2-GNP5-27]
KKRSLLQRHSSSQAEPSQVPPIVHEVLRSQGKPLDPNTRTFMESRFGHDFSSVQVHTDRKAAESAQVINALAYTVGQNIVFGTGEYAPGRSEGQKLLAHELTHVVQQSKLGSTIQPHLAIGLVQDQAEIEANRVAESVFSKDAGFSLPLVAREPTTFKLRRQHPTHQRETVDEPNSLRYRGGTLPYREATELVECIRIMGEENSAYCRHEVLGEPMPPAPTHHQLFGITTPQPISVRLNPNGTANFQIGGVNVTFQPDVRSNDPNMNNRAETSFNISYGAINFRSSGGRITFFTRPGTAQVTIQTTYGSGATSSSASGYGRGTTASDIAAGNTTLGFHEGQHGLDFVDFLSQNPFPQFRGRVGMTTRQFQRAINAYHSAIDRYRERINRFSELRTDCVGRTIDQSNQAQGFRTTICRQVAAPTP